LKLKRKTLGFRITLSFIYPFSIQKCKNAGTRHIFYIKYRSTKLKTEKLPDHPKNQPISAKLPRFC
jgi:hypothetical protein